MFCAFGCIHTLSASFSSFFFFHFAGVLISQSWASFADAHQSPVVVIQVDFQLLPPPSSSPHLFGRFQFKMHSHRNRHRSKLKRENARENSTDTSFSLGFSHCGVMFICCLHGFVTFPFSRLFCFSPPSRSQNFLHFLLSDLLFMLHFFALKKR